MIRSREYLEHVRTFACCGCRATEAVEAHHPDKRSTGGGAGLKGSDLLAVPLCVKCHEHGVHQSGRLPLCTTREATALVIAKAQVECLQSFLIQKVFGVAA